MSFRWICGWLAFLCLAGAAQAAQPTALDLDGQWQLIPQDPARSTVPATVPGCVHTDLLAAHQIESPFYGKNETALQWISDTIWTYQHHFQVPANLPAQQHVMLQCQGLETLATITLNGKPIGTTDNMFRTWEFDVRDQLHAGDNTIEIRFDPLAPYIARKVAEAHGPGTATNGFAEVRAEPASNGWDFGPKFVTCGIWRPIKLIAWSDARLRDFSTDIDLHDLDDAIVNVAISADTKPGVALQTNVQINYHGKQVAQEQLPLLADGDGRLQLRIPHPQLWWPNGMGAHPLYDVQVTLLDENQQTLDSATTRIGLRRIELLPKSGDAPLRLRINGKPLFLMGASWIPCEVFPTQVTTAKLQHYIQDAAAVHMNMLRCWGGGYYEENAFYDACDEAGILVWMDFKFACAAYPASDPAFMDNVRAEADDNIRRLRHHPSLAVWSGNNEVHGLVTNYKAMREEDYDKLFQQLLHDQVIQLVPNANYVPGSPDLGDEHNWWVWHVGAPFEKYLESHGLMTEFGFQSFPQPQTIASFTDAADRDSVLSDVMRFHQRNGNGRGNEMILEMIGRYFHPPRDFDSTLWLSQINQAFGLCMGIEHWRSDWPVSSGAIVWQYDDEWPGPTWAMVDYYGRWKAMMYRVRHAFAPLLVTGTADLRTGTAQIYVCSNADKPTTGAVQWTLTDTAGAAAAHGSLAVDLPAGTTSQHVGQLQLADTLGRIDPDNALLWLILVVDGHSVSQKLLIFDRFKNLDLQDPQITAHVQPAGNGFDIDLQAEKPALYAWLQLKNDPDARYDDNFVDLRPGEPITRIHIHPSKPLSLDEAKQNLVVRSLYDTYDATTVAAQANAKIVQQQPDGSIVATAATANIIGTSAILEAGSPPNIGHWDNPGDYLQWTMHVDRPGDFTVQIKTAMPGFASGSDYELISEGQTLPGTVPPTGGWQDYTTTLLGTLHLKHTGEIQLTLKATQMPHGLVMNLRKIVLQPVVRGQ